MGWYIGVDLIIVGGIVIALYGGMGSGVDDSVDSVFDGGVHGIITSSCTDVEGELSVVSDCGAVEYSVHSFSGASDLIEYTDVDMHGLMLGFDGVDVCDA